MTADLQPSWPDAREAVPLEHHAEDFVRDQQVERLARQGGTPDSSRVKLRGNSRIRASVDQLKVDLYVDEGHGVTTDPYGALLVGVDPWSTSAP